MKSAETKHASSMLSDLLINATTILLPVITILHSSDYAPIIADANLAMIPGLDSPKDTIVTSPLIGNMFMHCIVI